MTTRSKDTKPRRQQRTSPYESRDDASAPKKGTAPVSARAACEACRKLKMRCIRPQGEESNLSESCERCKRSNKRCTIPERKPQGRKPGALGRYRGIEKVYRKMQTELKKARASIDGVQRIQEITSHAEVEGETEILELLLSDAGSVPEITLSKQSDTRNTTDDGNQLNEHTESPNAMEALVDQTESPLSQMILSPGEQPEGNKNREPINNPLALLADASGAAQALHQKSIGSKLSPDSHAESAASYQTSSSSGCGMARQLLSRPGYVSLGLRLSRGSLEQGLDALFSAPDESEYRHLNYFRPSTAEVPRDVGPGLDPVDLGLVTMEEAYYLFPTYFTRFHPVHGILDPILHTLEYVRSRSALLFTWILAITSQFDETCSSLATRMRLHGDKLSKHVHTCGFKSVEIVQGYYISLLSATPAKTIGEERLWLYTNYAFSIAAELGLDERARPRNTGYGISSLPTRASSPIPFPPFDRTNSDDISLQDTSDVIGQRLARNRERTWLRILLWERANSAACGRITAFPETEITQNIESWWLHPLADSTDKFTCAFILFRREIVVLNIDLRTQAALPQPSNPHWAVKRVDSALQAWTQRWITRPASLSLVMNAGQTLLASDFSDIYLYYVYIHGRLWTLCYALYYVSKNTNDEQDLISIREDCFEAAIKVCEIAVEDLQTIGETLYCMQAPTWAMISYAAVLALQLFPLLHGSRSGYEVELLSLLGLVALQLERAGSTPSHRFGIAALLGQHLKMILRTKASNLNESVHQSENRMDLILGPQYQGYNHDGSLETTDIQSYDQFLTNFDPFFAATATSTDMESHGEVFTDMFRELFGQGFGGPF